MSSWLWPMSIAHRQPTRSASLSSGLVALLRQCLGAAAMLASSLCRATTSKRLNSKRARFQAKKVESLCKETDGQPAPQPNSRALASRQHPSVNSLCGLSDAVQSPEAAKKGSVKPHQQNPNRRDNSNLKSSREASVNTSHSSNLLKSCQNRFPNAFEQYEPYKPHHYSHKHNSGLIFTTSCSPCRTPTDDMGIRMHLAQWLSFIRQSEETVHCLFHWRRSNHNLSFDSAGDTIHAFTTQ